LSTLELRVNCKYFCQLAHLLMLSGLFSDLAETNPFIEDLDLPLMFADDSTLFRQGIF